MSTRPSLHLALLIVVADLRKVRDHKKLSPEQIGFHSPGAVHRLSLASPCGKLVVLIEGQVIRAIRAQDVLSFVTIPSASISSPTSMLQPNSVMVSSTAALASAIHQRHEPKSN